jgi:hypothetical protein
MQKNNMGERPGPKKTLGVYKGQKAEKARGAQGIGAEILLVCQKIGADSPVFCGFAAKNALL